MNPLPIVIYYGIAGGVSASPRAFSFLSSVSAARNSSAEASCEKHGDGFLTRKAQTEKSAPIRQSRSGFGVFKLPANEEQKMRMSYG